MLDPTKLNLGNSSGGSNSRYAAIGVLGALIIAGDLYVVRGRTTPTAENQAPQIQTSSDRNQPTNSATSITLDDKVAQTTSTTTGNDGNINQTPSPQISYQRIADSPKTLATFGIPTDASYNQGFSTKKPHTIDFKIYKSSDGSAMTRVPPSDKDGRIVYYGIGIKNSNGELIATGNAKPNELVNLGKSEFIDDEVEKGVQVYINAYRKVAEENNVIKIQKVASIANGRAKGYSNANQSLSYSSPTQKDSIDTILTDNTEPTNHSYSSSTSTDEVKYNIPTESAKKSFFAKVKNYFGIDKDTNQNYADVNDYQTANSQILKFKVKKNNVNPHALIFNENGKAIDRVSFQYKSNGEYSLNPAELNLKQGEYLMFVTGYGSKIDCQKPVRIGNYA